MTKKQRKEAYLNCARDFAEWKKDDIKEFGICWNLAKYRINSYIQDENDCITSPIFLPKRNNEGKEIELITNDGNSYYNFWTSECNSKELRITALLLAAEMCN